MQTIIISVGGSLIVPDNIDISFLRNFRNLIIKHIKKGKKFVIICGGGKTSRRYQHAAKSIVRMAKDDVDWIGIHSTRLNAQLLRTIFDNYANTKIVHNPIEKIRFRKKILIAAGWKPGFSTDYDAVMLAKNLGANKVVNLTNIDYVHTSDPKRYKKARPIKEISWPNFRELLPKKWDPGLNVPFDPVASREAEKLGLEVVIINGRKIKNLEKYLQGRDFDGTIIR